MIRNKIIIIVLISLSVLQWSCNNSDEKKIARKITIDKIVKVPIHIQRFEKELLKLNPDSLKEKVPVLQKQYGEILEMFNYINELPPSSNPKYLYNFRMFLTFYAVKPALNKVIEKYPNVNNLEKQFSDAFTQYHAFFPKKRIPGIFTCISAWSNSFLISDTLLGIALDNFLGRNCNLYDSIGVDKYKRYTMEPDYIVPEAIYEWCNLEFPLDDSKNNNVLSNILHKGKLIYLSKQIMPEINDTTLLGFNQKQLTWCLNNDNNMWVYLADKKLLFSTDYLTINKLVNPAPYTYYFSQESPGRAAIWLGYQIIRSYMKNNQKVTLPELMSSNDYAKILRESGYKAKP